jgi:hypothetical protein
MASGACVIRRESVRGVTWYVKFKDANGRQVKRRLDPREGPWNERKAQRALGVELERVERERWTKPTRETFAAFVEEWRRVYLPSRNLKRSTTRTRLTGTRSPTSGRWRSTRSAGAPRGVHRGKARGGLVTKDGDQSSGDSRRRLEGREAWRRVRSNPLDDVDRPRVDDPETQAKAGHSQFSITERYVHVAQVAFPGAVENAEARMVGST